MKVTDFSQIKQDERERVQVFIDGSNLYHGLKNECGATKLDFLAFSKLLASGRKLIRINYYTATLDAKIQPSQAKQQQKYLGALRHTPYLAVRHRPLKYRNSIPMEKGVDVMIATDMLTGALRNCYDTAVLVSGDGDFAEVIKEIKRTGKQVENATFLSNRSDALINAADLFLELTKADLGSCFLK